MLMHVGGRMSVVLFLPALAIATITGINVVISILIMGVCTIVYTAMGGMKAVMWTDFVQVIVLMGGAVFAIGFMFHALGGDAIFETASGLRQDQAGQLQLRPDAAHGLGLHLPGPVRHGADLPQGPGADAAHAGDELDKEAGRSIWVFAAIMMPGGFIFYIIGTALFAYYKAHPERLDPLLPIDATFPLFIGAELPQG